jgi:hypothetical protein
VIEQPTGDTIKDVDNRSGYRDSDEGDQRLKGDEENRKYEDDVLLNAEAAEKRDTKRHGGLSTHGVACDHEPGVQPRGVVSVKRCDVRV